ncbi:MAG: rhodanese-like domain-containing protein [Paludibacter sp.]|nr:rhodanese-like domain-containing protein [Paludibacter sp.]
MLAALKKLLGIEPQVDLKVLINEGATILDVRTKGEFSTGHIRGSVNIPVEKLSTNLTKLKSRSKPIITCCATGSRSASAKGILTANGFTNVHNGGAWLSLRRKLDIY